MVAEAHLTRKEREFQRALVKRLGTGLTSAQLRDHILYLCDKYDYNPMEELIKLVVRGVHVSDDADPLPILDPDLLYKIHKEVAQYVMPKLRALEVSGNITGDIHITVRKFSDDPVKEAISVEAETNDEEPEEEDR